MALSCIIFDIKSDINRKSRFFYIPLAFDVFGVLPQSCTTLDPTRGSGQVGSGQKIYRKGRVGWGRVGSS